MQSHTVLYAHHLLHIHRVQQAPMEASHFGMPDKALHPERAGVLVSAPGRKHYGDDLDLLPDILNFLTYMHTSSSFKPASSHGS